MTTWCFSCLAFFSFPWFNNIFYLNVTSTCPVYQIWRNEGAYLRRYIHYSPRVAVKPLTDWLLYYQVVDPEYGYLEPLSIAPGKITLRQALDLLNSHKQDAETNTVEALAQKYSLDARTVSLIIEYFQPFNMMLPKPEHMTRRSHPLLKDYDMKSAQKLLDNVKDGLHADKKKTWEPCNEKRCQVAANGIVCQMKTVIPDC